MPFEHACFISYRHAASGVMERFVGELSEALQNELMLSVGKGPYVDHERLRGGDFFNPRLASALCRSACMVLVYTPVYFDAEHPYCAREFRAMEALEQSRLQALGHPADQQHGLIVPIILRGLDRLPAFIKGQRQFHDFSSFTLVDRRMTKHPRYAHEIKTLSEYISARYFALKDLPDDPCAGCDNFSLPPEAEVQQWLQGLRGGVSPFPMREQ